MISVAGPPWYLGEIADAVAETLAALDHALQLEEAPHGLDAWDERPLQQAVAGALGGRLEVAREVCYPSSEGRKASHRARCDLVVSRPGECPPEEALWLELKVARQWRCAGVRDARYAPQWRRHLIADLRKLTGETRIHAAAAVLIAFTEDAVTLDRDLDAFESELVRAGVVAGFRQVRTLPIVDRIGHRLAAVVLWPTV